MINTKTQLCAVIGNPIEHSLSPAIHNAAFDHLGLNYAYLAFRVEDVSSAIAGIRGMGIRGLSVTIPHKVEVIKYLDEIDEVADRIGSVNTIVNENRSLKGYTTDGTAAVRSLKEKGVDIMLAVDLVESAIKNEANAFIVLSGDADFIPAMKLVKNNKKEIFSSSLAKGYSRELRKSFRFFVLGKNMIMENCLK